MNKFFQFSEYIKLGKIFNDCTAYLISIEYLDKAIELSTYLPINKNRLVKAYELRGNSKIFLNNYQESILDFSKAIEINPNYENAYVNRGISRKNIKDFKGSIMDYEKALSINSKDAITFHNLALSKKEIGDIKGACLAMEKSLSLGNKIASKFIDNECKEKVENA